MASGWNLWVCLQCIGVAGGRCCKEVYRYPHNNNNNNNNNNNTHIAATAPLPLTTHPRWWVELLTFGPKCTLPF